MSLILSDLLLHSLLAAHSRPYFIDPIFYFLHAFGASRYFLHLGPIDPHESDAGPHKRAHSVVRGGRERYPRADGSRRQELTIDCCRQIVPHSARLTRYERERGQSAGEGQVKEKESITHQSHPPPRAVAAHFAQYQKSAIFLYRASHLLVIVFDSFCCSPFIDCYVLYTRTGY